MKYVTLNDLNRTIRNNFWKVPHDIDFIITIPRSGAIVGNIIATYLNVPVVDINSFCEGVAPYGGGRWEQLRRVVGKKVLVVDDTVFNGTSMRKTKDRMKNFSEYQFTYLVAYLEGSAISEVDIYLEDLRQFTTGVGIVLYEWNIFHHYPFIMSRCMYDIDGVFCLDPPDERTGEEYVEYIKSPVPLFCPTVQVGKVVTYRLEKYRDVTEKWLASQGIRYNQLVMSAAGSWEERSKIGPGVFKAQVYKSDPNSILFVESEDRQAQEIYRISGKPVLSIETNKLYS